MATNGYAVVPPPRTARYAIYDGLAAFYFMIASIVFIGLGEHAREHPWVMAHPYILAFLKFACLATFGECLRGRIVAGRWIVRAVLVRALIWGCLGVWIAFAFQVIDAGVGHLLGPGAPAVWRALCASVWINLLSGYGFFMMTAHFVTDRIIDDGWQSPWRALQHPSFSPWARIVMLTLVCFWVPAHTITFLLPPAWRVVFAAYLGIALGLLLSFSNARARRQARMASAMAGHGLALALGCMGVLAAGRAYATEGGGSVYPTGVNTVMPAILPGPNETELFNYIVDVPMPSLNNAKGRSTVPFRANLFAYAPRLVHGWDVDYHGLHLETGVSPVLQRKSVRVGDSSDFAMNMSSFDLQALYLTWSHGNVHLMVGQDFWFPGSTFNRRALANVSPNKVTFMPEGAVTWMPGRWEVSVEFTGQFSTINPATHYHDGALFDLDYGIGYRPFRRIPKLQVGIQGNFANQFSDDMQYGVPYENGYRMRNFTIGPQFVYSIRRGMGVALKWQHNVVSHNTVGGERFWVQFAFPL